MLYIIYRSVKFTFYYLQAEEAPYYERGYPRARMEYAEPALVSGSAYLDAFRYVHSYQRNQLFFMHLDKMHLHF